MLQHFSINYIQSCLRHSIGPSEVGIDPVSIVDFTEHIFHGEVREVPVAVTVSQFQCGEVEDNLEGTLNFPKFMEAEISLISNQY